MLQTLAIRDFAIISALDLRLNDGLTVVTGETGAGKSIVLDALSLLAGARTDKGVVRTGAERAELAAEFSLQALKSVQRWLKDQELDDADHLESVHVRRVVRADGQGSAKAWINGRSVTIAQLRELMDQLLEIHGQHDSMLLQEAARQMQLIDQFADNQSELQALAQSCAQLRAIDQEINDIKQMDGSGAELLELLTQQLQELKKQNLSQDHLKDLDQKQRKLANADDLISALEHVLAKLDGDTQTSLPRQLHQVQHELMRFANVDKKLSEAAALLESAGIEIEEANALIADVRADLALDPRALAEVEAELSKVHELARKHRVPVGILAEKLAEIEQRVQKISGSGERLEKLHEQKAATILTWQKLAQSISQKRQLAAKKLCKAAEDFIQSLGMQGGKLAFEFYPKAAHDYSPSGAETGEFMVSANPGQALRALRKTASGGELSRISLALKVATLKNARVPVLLFDEVDAGIGGAVASTVGSLLAKLGKAHQVLVVTHLAQVAAFGAQHWLVRKASNGKQTQTDVITLSGDVRVDELARMLSGQVTASTQAAASELFSNSNRAP
jgi:DNA repair protein RecN (Recombination protein N)